MVTQKDRLRATALELLSHNPKGLRYSDLVTQIQAVHSTVKSSAIQGAIWDLDKNEATREQVYKPARGLFRHVNFRETESETEDEGGETSGETSLEVSVEAPDESQFYEPFANYLLEREECTKAVELGGALFGGKWETPDVYGVWETDRRDAMQGRKITTAEIKVETDSRSLVTGLGQACAYKLFSHKVYLVIPKESSLEFQQKIESLCIILGLGLILFDKSNPANPNWERVVSPVSGEPDLYYMNEKYDLAEPKLSSIVAGVRDR